MTRYKCGICGILPMTKAEYTRHVNTAAHKQNIRKWQRPERRSVW